MASKKVRGVNHSYPCLSYSLETLDKQQFLKMSKQDASSLIKRKKNKSEVRYVCNSLTGTVIKIEFFESDSLSGNYLGTIEIVNCRICNDLFITLSPTLGLTSCSCGAINCDVTSIYIRILPMKDSLDDVNWRKVTVNNTAGEPYLIIQDTTQLAVYNETLKNLLASNDNSKEAEIELLDTLIMGVEKYKS